MAGDLTDELFEAVVVSMPLLDLRDQVQGNINGVGLGLEFIGEMPAQAGAAGAWERTERAFQEGADPSELAQGGVPASGMAVGRSGFSFHIGSINT